MLPPLSATASTPLLYKGQRFDIAAAGVGALPQPEQSSERSGLELNAAIVGKLNLLLLTSDERVAQNFTILADVFGRSLGLSRKEGETATVFAQRIVEALANLPPERRAAIEAQLDQLFKGLKLSMVIAAFENPSGPAATAMALHLEGQSADRDLATKSVVTTYLQNNADDRAPGAEQRPQAAPVQAAKATLAAAVANAPASNTQQPATQSNLSLIGPMLPQADGEVMPAATPRVAAAAMPTTAATSPGDEARSRQMLPFGASQPAEPNIAVTPSAAAAAQSHASAERETVAGLQNRLQANFVTTNDDAAGSRSAEPKSAAPAAQQTRANGASSSEKSAPMPQANADMEKAETLYALKGWQEVSVLASSGKPDKAQADSIGKLLKASLFGGQQQETNTKSLEVETRQPLDPAKTDESAKASRQALTPEPTAAATQAQQQDAMRSRGDAIIAALAESVEAETAALVVAPAARNAAALPMVHYLFARDHEQAARSEELNYPFQQGQGDGDEFEDQNEEAAEQDAGDGEEDAAEGLQHPDASVEEAASSSVNDGDGESANDLYWRMAGWP